MSVSIDVAICGFSLCKVSIRIITMQWNSTPEVNQIKYIFLEWQMREKLSNSGITVYMIRICLVQIRLWEWQLLWPVFKTMKNLSMPQQWDPLGTSTVTSYCKRLLLALSLRKTLDIVPSLPARAMHWCCPRHFRYPRHFALFVTQSYISFNISPIIGYFHITTFLPKQPSHPGPNFWCETARFQKKKKQPGISGRLIR